MLKITKYLILIAGLVLVSHTSFSQTGDEWIVDGQEYYKIPVGKEGIYKIDYANLTALGPALDNVDPRNFQLFRNGKEQYIYVQGEQDGSFDQGDVIEFYGQKNDGSLETKLYKSASDQPHQDYSIFTDTSSYYLTWSSSPSSKRYSAYYDNNYAGKTSNTDFMHTATQVFTSDYFAGIPVNNDGAQLYSEYTGGEGFHKWVWSSQGQFNVALPAINTSGPNATIDVIAYSGNHNTGVILNNYNHEFGLSFNTRANIIARQKTLGYERVDLSATVAASELKPTTSVFLGEITFSGSGFNVSRLSITYPRLLDLDKKTNLHVQADFTSSFFDFANYASAKSAPVVYDLSSKKRVTADKQADNHLLFNLPNAGNLDFIILDETEILPIARLEKVQTISYSPNPSVDYLIITNKKLETGAQAYKTYRESSNGGSHTVQIVYVQDLYDYYGYGIESPIAVRNFIGTCNDLLPNLKNILILGKGQLYNRIRSDNARKIAYNLVPSIGIPASDYLYVSPLNSSRLNIDYGIGRVPARSNDQIAVYLEKLTAFESQPTADWQKKIIQLAGGTAGENATFRSYLNSYYSVIKDTSLGGYRVLFSKNEPVPVQSSLTGKIQEELNKGAGMLSYFGHGAAQVTEISLGEPDQLNNFEKTPIFLFNGCALGNTYEDLSLAERFLFEPRNGALGWVASSNFGFTGSLFAHTLEVHKALFNTTYGQGIGQAMKKASENYGSPSQALSVLEARQLVYHGDPVLDIFAPDKPDYYVKSAKVSAYNGTSQDSLGIELVIANNGKAFSNPLELTLRMTNSSQALISRKSTQLEAPFYTTTLALKVSSENLGGLINFEILLDSSNRIDELAPFGETNNTYTFQHLIKQQKPTILVPINDAIVTTSEVKLVVQIPGYSGTLRTIDIEIDSLPYFTSPIASTSISTEKTLLKEKLNLPSIENKDYYLRTRYIESGKVSEWSYGTFGFIQGDSQGWTEGNRWKFLETSSNYLEIDSLTGNFQFQRTNSEEYLIETGGDGIGRFGMSRWIVVDGWPAIYGWWPQNGVNLMVIDNNTGERYMEQNSAFNLALPKPWAPFPAGRPYTTTGEKCGVYHYNTNLLDIQDSLAAFLDRIPENYHLILNSAQNCDVPNWKPNLWAALDNFGVSKIKTIGKGDPFTVISDKKSINPSPATEYIADYSSPVTPPQMQRFSNGITFQPFAESGNIESKPIGPVSEWYTLTVFFSNLNSTDSFNIDVFKSTNCVNWVNEMRSVNSSTIDLSSIDANTYPFVKFNVNLFDNDNRSAAAIDRWKINCKNLNEGSIVLDDNFKFNYDTLDQGANLQLALNFTNITERAYDSSGYYIAIKNLANGNIDTVKHGQIGKLNPEAAIIIYDTISTKNINGNFELLLAVNDDKKVKEQTYDNNYFTKDFYVLRDSRNPLLDVVFDGRHILNHDIISPNTEISIVLSDDNPYFTLQDPSLISASLTAPDGQVDTLNPQMLEVSFIPGTKPNEDARLVYKAANLMSGDYLLNVKVKDASGNYSSDLGYSVNFTVIQESSITNIYPYPNPFSSKMKFVYTLTGSSVPDYFKIQIMTISGKVVREISQYELGTIQIGNNISEFTWDGTDEFGDPLANGVYLYKVTAKINGEEIAHRNSGGDQFFNDGFGKIYLAR